MSSLLVAQFLIEQFGTATLQQSSAISAFKVACSLGNMKSAEWVADHFVITSADARDVLDYIKGINIHGLIQRRNAEVVAWLQSSRFA